jgi:hypothetical protein
MATLRAVQPEPVRGGRPDIPALVAGLGVLTLGGVLMLDALGTIDLTFGVFGPLACAVTGAILLASGLSRRE